MKTRLIHIVTTAHRVNSGFCEIKAPIFVCAQRKVYWRWAQIDL